MIVFTFPISVLLQIFQFIITQRVQDLSLEFVTLPMDTIKGLKLAYILVCQADTFHVNCTPLYRSEHGELRGGGHNVGIPHALSLLSNSDGITLRLHLI